MRTSHWSRRSYVSHSRSRTLIVGDALTTTPADKSPAINAKTMSWVMNAATCLCSIASKKAPCQRLSLICPAALAQMTTTTPSASSPSWLRRRELASARSKVVS